MVRHQAKTKIRIDFTDQAGSKYTLSMQGTSKETIPKIFDFIDSISVPPNNQDEHLVDTNFGRLYGLIQNKLRFSNFTSVDVMEAYQEEFGIPVNLATISTYLSRLWDRGYLDRSRTRFGWSYRLNRSPEETTESAQEPSIALQ